MYVHHSKDQNQKQIKQNPDKDLQSGGRYLLLFLLRAGLVTTVTVGNKSLTLNWTLITAAHTNRKQHISVILKKCESVIYWEIRLEMQLVSVLS